MLAILLLVAATTAGMLVVSALLRSWTGLACGAWTRAGIAIALGQLALLWLPFLAAAAFDLSARVAGLSALVILTSVSAAALAARATRISLSAWLAQLAAGLVDRRNALLVAVGGAFLVLLGFLHHTHYLVPRADGLHSAGVTWGDLSLHLSIVSRFLFAEGMPALDHPLFLNEPLVYPFLPDYSIAVLTALGLPMRWSFIAGGMLPLVSLLLLIHGATRLWIAPKAAHVSALAIALFLLAGGLGFVFSALRLIDGSMSFAQLLGNTNATYDISPHILKAGHIGNLFLASRSAGYGMSIGLSAMLLLGYAQQAEPGARTPRMPLVIAGIAAGSLPLVHSHSFLVVAGVIGCAFVLQRRKDLWLVLVPLACVALPQMLWLTRAGTGGFVRIAFGFLRPAPSASDALLDLVLSMGIWLLLVPLGWRVASARTRRLVWPLLALLPLACVVTVTPAVYDNIKWLAWFDLAAAVLVAGFIAQLPRLALRAALVLGCTLSGALAIGHELKNDSRVVSYAENRFAQLVAAHTPSSAIIATASSEHDPVALLSGRRVLMAGTHILFCHGIAVRPRAMQVAALYAGGERAEKVIAELGVTAVVIGPEERRGLPAIDEAFFAQRARAMYETDGRRLYVLDASR